MQQYKSLHLVHPDYLAPIHEINNLVETKGLAGLEEMFSSLGEAHCDERWQAPAQGSQPAVDLCVYKPKNARGKLPVIYYCHGGGYLAGNAMMYADMFTDLAECHKAAVVSVEYRLAPQAPFPADLNDAYHGLAYIHQQAAEFGLDTDKLILMGESAGGGLTARLALLVRDKGEFHPVGQVLIYPMLDCRSGTENSPYHQEYVGEFLWTHELNRLGWDTLRGGQELDEQQLGYFSPSLAKNLTGLPKTFMIVGSLDLFVNEDIDYANRLIQAGVPTDLLVLNGCIHAFDALNPTAEPTLRYMEARTRAINEMLAR